MLGLVHISASWLGLLATQLNMLERNFCCPTTGGLCTPIKVCWYLPHCFFFTQQIEKLMVIYVAFALTVINWYSPWTWEWTRLLLSVDWPLTLLAFSSSEGYILPSLKKKTKQHQQKRMIPNFVCSVGFNQPLLTFPIDTLIAKLHFWYWKIQDISNNQLHLSRLLRLMPLGMKEIWSYLVTSLLSLLARLFDRRKVKVVINEL